MVLLTACALCPPSTRRALGPPRAQQPDGESSITELLQQMRLLPVVEPDDSHPLPSHLASPDPPPPSGLDLKSVRQRARSLLADSALAPSEKQEHLAELIKRSVESGRVRSAQLVFDLALKRARKLSLTRPGGDALSRPLLSAGICCLTACRDQPAYEALLAASQTEFGINLTAQDGLLSDAMIGCCRAGWAQHAAVINATLTDAGRQPSTAALNALMELRLERRDIDGAFDIFVHMRRHGPAPDRRSHQLVTRGAVARKSSWSGLRNLLRRNWLKVPWNEHSANAAVSALLESGNLRAASGAISHMQSIGTRLQPESLISLLAFASVTRDSQSDSLIVFSAVQQLAYPLPARACLLLLRQLQPSARIDLLLRCLAEPHAPPDLLRLQSAIALTYASVGEGRRSASWLRWLHEEGADLARALVHADEVLDSEAREAGEEAVAAHAVRAAAAEEEEAGGGGGREGAGGGVGREGGGEARVRPPCNLWLSAVDACGADVASGLAICDSMEAVGELDLQTGRGAEALIALLAVCSRAAAVRDALQTLGRLGHYATAEAYVRVVEASCATPAASAALGCSPSMDTATATVDRMADAGALDGASSSQLLRLFVALISGFGKMTDLDAAHAAFVEACEWMEERRTMEEVGRTTREEAGRPTREEVGRTTREEVGGGGEVAQSEWWIAAERSVYQAMVDAAAPHPRGLLLACRLLEQLKGRSGVSLSKGYYRQLINGHATAYELSETLEELQGARRGTSLVSAASWGVSDSTVAALMESLRRAQEEGIGGDLGWGVEGTRKSALSKLREHGLSLDRRVAEYLRSGRKLRGSKHVNLNDEIATRERGESPRDSAGLPRSHWP